MAIIVLAELILYIEQNKNSNILFDENFRRGDTSILSPHPPTHPHKTKPLYRGVSLCVDPRLHPSRVPRKVIRRKLDGSFAVKQISICVLICCP